MNFYEIVRYIYEHALSMIEPWDDDIIELVSKPELTNDGFRITAPEAPEYWVGMKEFQGTIFIQVHELRSNYSSMARNQEKAKAIYNRVVDALLAA